MIGKWKENELKIPIIINIVLVFFIYIDFYIPSKEPVEETFMSFYNVVKYIPRVKGGGGKDVKYILECSNKKLYYLYRFPENESDIKSGQKIYISETILLSKVKSLQLNPHSTPILVSFLANKIISYFFVLALVISVLNILFSFTFLELLLPFSCAYIFLVSLYYLFYL